jgi:hypothetical protein
MEFFKYEDAIDFVKFCPDEAAAGARKTAAYEFSGCCSAELFAEIGYEAVTMTAIAEPRISRRSTVGQLTGAHVARRREV